MVINVFDICIFFPESVCIHSVVVESGHRRKVKKYCLQTGHYANELISKPMVAVCKLFASADPLRNHAHSRLVSQTNVEYCTAT